MNSPFNFFDKIYCINLDRRTDRWELAQKEFEKVGILDRVEKLHAFDLPSDPCRGNHLSHGEALAFASLYGAKNVLIFEDDVQFFDNPIETLTKAIEELPWYWGMFYFGINMDQFYAQQVSPTLARLQGGFATHAYAVSHTMYEQLYRINVDNNTVHNDVAYSSVMPGQNVYVTIPLIAGQRDSYSDIEHRVMSSNQMFLDRFEKRLIRK